MFGVDSGMIDRLVEENYSNLATTWANALATRIKVHNESLSKVVANLISFRAARTSPRLQVGSLALPLLNLLASLGISPIYSRSVPSPHWSVHWNGLGTATSSTV
jgi:hypothetical protein